MRTVPLLPLIAACLAACACARSRSAGPDPSSVGRLEDRLVGTLLADYCGDAGKPAVICRVPYPQGTGDRNLFPAHAPTLQCWVREKDAPPERREVAGVRDLWDEVRKTTPWSHLLVRFAYRLEQDGMRVRVLMESTSSPRSRIGARIEFRRDGERLEIVTHQRIWLD